MGSSLAKTLRKPKETEKLKKVKFFQIEKKAFHKILDFNKKKGISTL